MSTPISQSNNDVDGQPRPLLNGHTARSTHDSTTAHPFTATLTNHPCPLDVLVVGAGLGGLAAAIACSLAGHRVVCLEAATQLGEVGAGIQLSPNVTRLLRAWGLFPRLEPIAVRPGKIVFRRWQTGEPIGLTRLVPDFERDFGAPYWVVHRAHLHQALYERARELGVEVHVDSRVKEVDFEKAQVMTVRLALVSESSLGTLIQLVSFGSTLARHTRVISSSAAMA